jgi:hypothetical protein
MGLLSCGDEYLWSDVNCDECYTDKPKVGPVTVNVSIDSENKRIPIRIFKGEYKESYRTDLSKAIQIDTLEEESAIYDLDVNEYYSIVAEYSSNGKKIIAVNGDKLKIYRVSDSCDGECWIFRGGKLDATLKK